MEASSSEASLVLIEPEIPENTGFIARLCANFGYSLRVVSPDFNLSEARNTAKSCQGKLRDAEIFDSVEEAIDDLDFVVGTKPGRGIELNEFEPRENTSVMVGRESRGLTNDELDLCDAVVNIDTCGYSSINQSHAAGILMYSMSSRAEGEGIDQDSKDTLVSNVGEVTSELILRANPSRAELDAVFSELMG